MPQTLFRLVHIIVRNGRVRRDAIVPDSDGAVVPLDADLQVGGDGDVL